MYELEIKNLNIGYGERVLAKDVTFELKQGEILSVLGPNGVGKSTLLKTILLLTKPMEDKGDIILEGKNIKEYKDSERAKIISALLTEHFPTGNFYVKEVVEAGRYPFTGYFGRLLEQDEKIVDRISKELDIQNFFDKHFSTLSDGQKQRVLLARALCQNPRLLILDEPFSYLDINFRLKISQYLKEKAKTDNYSIILTIQEPSEAFYISDKVLMLFDDEHSEFGEKEKMLTEEKLRLLYDVKDFSFNEVSKDFFIEK